MFRSQLSEDIYNHKYKHTGCETWEQLSRTLVEDVCGPKPYDSYEMPKSFRDQLYEYHRDGKIIFGGRYLYYAGRSSKFYSNCYLLKSLEDNREDWAELSKKAELCLATGGGIGNDYSVYRGRGSLIKRTGGVASGPISKMLMVNEIGRHIRQGGDRRSAIYASLHHKHADIYDFLSVKNWAGISVANGLSLLDIKSASPEFPAPLDGTNISVNYDTDWLLNYWKTGDVGDVFRRNVAQALRTGEPGFSFNFFEKETETLRNACTEVTSSDDSDVCNLGSLNFARITSLEELASVTELAIYFLLMGTLRADLPYDKVRAVREKNRRLGLGIMGLHEWLLQRQSGYEVTPELHRWLTIYKGASDYASSYYSNRLSISTPIANRAIAPTGTIGIIAGTTTGIEPVYAAAYKRRYAVSGGRWKFQYHVDHIARELVDRYSVDPDGIESAEDLASNPSKRIRFQAEIQDYVDQGISSTINLAPWGSEGNNEDTVSEFTSCLAQFAHRLRGFTCFPSGSRGSGQPLVKVPYKEAISKLGEEFEDNVEINDVCDITGGGFCGS